MADLFCASSPEAAVISDGEFWEKVAISMGVGGRDDDDYDDDQQTAQADPCPECGQIGPCAYDVEGRPMIHTTEGNDR